MSGLTRRNVILSGSAMAGLAACGNGVGNQGAAAAQSIAGGNIRGKPSTFPEEPDEFLHANGPGKTPGPVQLDQPFRPGQQGRVLIGRC